MNFGKLARGLGMFVAANVSNTTIESFKNDSMTGWNNIMNATLAANTTIMNSTDNQSSNNVGINFITTMASFFSVCCCILAVLACAQAGNRNTPRR